MLNFYLFLSLSIPREILRPSREDEPSDIMYRGHARVSTPVHVVGIYRLCRWSLVWTSSTIPPRENAVFFFSPLPSSRLLLPHLPSCFSTSSSSYYYFSSSSTYNPPSPCSSSLLPLFLFLFRDRRRVATPVSDSPQPAIGAALVLCEAIRMYVCESCPSFHSSSSCSFFSPPLPRRRMKFLVAVRTIRNCFIAQLAKIMRSPRELFTDFLWSLYQFRGWRWVDVSSIDLITQCQGFCFIRKSHIRFLFFHDLGLLLF